MYVADAQTEARYPLVLRPEHMAPCTRGPVLMALQNDPHRHFSDTTLQQQAHDGACGAQCAVKCTVM